MATRAASWLGSNRMFDLILESSSFTNAAVRTGFTALSGRADDNKRAFMHFRTICPILVVTSFVNVDEANRRWKF